MARPARHLFTLALLVPTLLSGCAQTERVRDGGVVIRYDTVHHPEIGNAGMVVTQSALASEVGQAVLRRGGNAVDAAVAVGFALAVTLPRAGNLGGSGFMLVHMAGQSTLALDFRSAAPAAYDPERYRRADGSIDLERLKFGAHANGVPGTVAGLGDAWRRFGSLPWADLVRPAIELAARGIEVSPDLAHALRSEQAVFQRFPSSRAVYFDPATNATYAAGALWRQPDLAASLQQIAGNGAGAFYRGELARRLVDGVQAAGGYLSLEDLARYQARERQPLRTRYRNRTVVAMPPVSGGGLTLLSMLNMLSHFELAEHPQGSAASLHLLAEVMKQGAANRRFGIGDPDFVDVPVDEFLSPRLARRYAGMIDPERARSVADVVPRHRPDPKTRDTTHYSIMDRWGNAVATTYTLGYSFGSGFVAPGTGILLDNQLRNFSYRLEEGGASHANAHAPGKRMMSTMTPTLVLNDSGQVEVVTGSPGGGRIINVVLQVLVNLLDYGMNPAEATHAPRIHQPWRSETLGVEPGIGVDTVALLRARGHVVEQQASMGSTQTVVYRDGLFYGAADPRRPGALALGLTAGGVIESQHGVPCCC